MKIAAIPSEPQKLGASFLIKRSRGMLCYATGSGKTVIQILAAFRLVYDKEIDKFLFVGTKNSLIEIQKDFDTWTDMRPTVVDDSIGSWEAWMLSPNPIAVTQYNWVEIVTAGYNASKQRCVDRAKMVGLFNLLRTKKVAVSFDEIHTLKNPESSISRAFKLLRPAFVKVYGVTGTGIMRNLHDLYHMVNFIAPGYLGTMNEFNDLFVVMKKQRIGAGRSIWVIKEYRNLPLLKKKLEDVLLEYYPQQDVKFNSVMAELVDRTTYEEAARGVFENTLDPKQHSARLIDLQYVVNRDASKKKALLEDLKVKLEKGVLIYCAYYESLRIVQGILDEIGVKWMEINGKKESEERKSAKEWFHANPKNKALLITRAGGQCFQKGTMVRLYSGLSKAVEDVREGDLLMGPDSTPRKVETLARGRSRMFSVTSPGETPYVVNQEHILSLRLGSKCGKLSKGALLNIKVDDFTCKGKWFKEIVRGWRSGVEYGEKTLPIPPYILGLWLGDGCRRSTTLYVKEGEDQIAEVWKDYGKTLGLYDLTSPQPGASKITITAGGVGLPTSNKMLLELRGLDLILNKHIPLLYKTASREQRLQLLAGFMDTDGSLHNGCGAEITQSLKVLADDVKELARSLGFDSRWAYSERSYKKGSPLKGRYRVSIAGDLTGIPTILAHKRSLPRRSPKNPLWSRIEVKEIGEGRYYGFEVSGPDRMFLLEDFTVVHNSLNLQATPNITFFDTPFGVGYFLQAMGRVVREYSEFKEFFITFIVVKGTIDEYKYELISANRDVFMRVFNNGAIPSSDKMPSFNSYVIARLKKALLWRETGRRSKFSMGLPVGQPREGLLAIQL